MSNQLAFFRYWGKSSRDFPPRREQYPGWHLLPYHSLDVAAVAYVWWDSSRSIRRAFPAVLDVDRDDEQAMTELKAWLLFFVALHDLGKFDVRFQSKAPGVTGVLWPELGQKLRGIPPDDRRHYDHGIGGYCWFSSEADSLLGIEDEDNYYGAMDYWAPWLASVAGHHGEIISPNADSDGIRNFAGLEALDIEARKAWFAELEALFLVPVGLSLRDRPPQITNDNRAAQNLIAGFCSVADWVGSNTRYFSYCAEILEPAAYLSQRIADITDKRVLHSCGLQGQVLDYSGITALLPEGEKPRGVQTMVDALPVESGLLLVEAPTGSGKTEAALGYAWRLLEAGLADSIVFALPTQATANAMLKRLEDFAKLAFREGTNIVLAHGKSQLNDDFKRLTETGRRPSIQGEEEAAAQCTAWLAQSRKRAFLGQIGVCTVDQVLLSALPVRHKFVRGFGINHGVLIVDEVHAYDSYMTGLLEEILARQARTGGSALLLSATLPANQRKRLVEAWGAKKVEDSNDYPLLTHAMGRRLCTPELSSEHHPEPRTVAVECLATPKAEPDEATMARVIEAAESGAQVVLIVNLVDVAQKAAKALRDKTSVPVDIFHARYRFEDRKAKEKAAIGHYGKEAAREAGRILVATQVVEQSLDLDFDWMVTQICPVDLLFQRLGRLHRHNRSRPSDFESSRCTVLVPESGKYGLIECIYGDPRLLWRTEQLLKRPGGLIEFPGAYRQWIEAVYGEAWSDDKDEPEDVFGGHCGWKQRQEQKRSDAARYVRMNIREFRDDQDTVASLTRDEEMGHTVLPLSADGKAFLDGRRLKDLDDMDKAEAINLNGIPAPASWRFLQSLETNDEGCRVLPMERQGGVWRGAAGSTDLTYSQEYGLAKAIKESGG
ncbi:CRISPR-associated helicase/endonuclease Cas3 [Methylococcus sp. EFPC2]|uniref:CRISPR-associated helicase/endonuclease Cas3 n=1 Tax=Methylococcus sp. EFPC2 TaxID=2812648 RepID=UPI0019679EF7|nr:CRISPR-associated helicase/endonuclease Cas3 [Methylococcus sp. EFPC2]QSA96787.1 CRISPR-associated helicase/endonuclease Cas3 [Methylococcus sp. EFPC2]